MTVTAEHLRNAFEYFDTTERLEVYGVPPESIAAGRTVWEIEIRVRRRRTTS